VIFSYFYSDHEWKKFQVFFPSPKWTSFVYFYIANKLKIAYQVCNCNLYLWCYLGYRFFDILF